MTLPGKYRSEGYLWHSELPKADTVLMTSQSLVVIGVASDYCEVLWECFLALLTRNCHNLTRSFTPGINWV